MKKASVITVFSALITTLATSSIYAGNSWFSQVRNTAPTNTTTATPSSVTPQSIQPATASSASVFDIVITLESDPQGDDDPSVNGTNDADQQKYENIVREFADGVCQSTNTAHKLGVVRIFRNLQQKDSADILWNSNCAANKGPRANPSGFGKSGQKIWMCDNWSGAGTFNPLLDNAKAAGFTLTHEWGHYTYGLYDEYASGPTTGADFLPQ